VRTELNVEDSHGTLIVYREEMDEGTLLTQQSAQKFNKPLFIINASISFDEENFRHWLTTNSISRLNIAGPRESNSPGIYKVTKDILTTLLKSTI
jgi:hypothetical protein